MVAIDNTIYEITSTTYNPNHMTPLYDAMGFSISKLRNALINLENYEVLVTILTDGLENHSREYTGNTIKKFGERLKTQGWTFTYIDADHDVYPQANSIAVNNVLIFNKDKKEIEKMVEAERMYREKYYPKVLDKIKGNNEIDLNKDFYEDKNTSKENN